MIGTAKRSLNMFIAIQTNQGDAKGPVNGSYEEMFDHYCTENATFNPLTTPVET